MNYMSVYISIVLLMRFEDFLTSSTKVMIEKGVPPRIVTFFKSIVLLHEYCFFIIFKDTNILY